MKLWLHTNRNLRNWMVWYDESCRFWAYHIKYLLFQIYLFRDSKQLMTRFCGNINYYLGNPALTGNKTFSVKVNPRKLRNKPSYNIIPLVLISSWVIIGHPNKQTERQTNRAYYFICNCTFFNLIKHKSNKLKLQIS